MILYIHSKYNYFTKNNFSGSYDNIQEELQNEYDNIITHDIHLHTITCTCKQIGRFVHHGSYTRYINYFDMRVKLRINRIKCLSCHCTHAILLDCIVPYHHTLLHDILSIIKITTHENKKNFLKQRTSISEYTFYYIKRSFIKHWKQRLLSLQIRLEEDLIRSCIYHFKRSFMQINCTPVNFYSLST